VASSLVSSQLVSQSQTISRAQSRRPFTRILDLWHLASLDAPTVAVVWAHAVAGAAGVRLEPWIPLLLACGTWTVYVVDRLLDARRAINAHDLSTLRERHYFHWRHRHPLLPLATCAAGVAVALILKWMPVGAREHNSLIAAAALIYFSGVHAPAELPQWTRRLVSKELLVGILFAAGCAAPALSHLRSAASAWSIFPAVIFLASLAWLNCAAIDMWESQSIRIHIPAAAATLTFIGVTAAVGLAAYSPHVAALLAGGAISALSLFILHRTRHRLHPVTLRALADLVLLAPAILLISGAPRV
jgi:hypothetical protein